MRYVRVRIFNQGVVPGNADAVWAFSTDWAKERLDPSRPKPKLLAGSMRLVGGFNDVPRTRVMETPGIGRFSETILHQSNETRHLVYKLDGEGPMGVLNYLAILDVDPLDEAHSQITITARFDLPEDQDVLAAKALFDRAHNQSIIGGARTYFGEPA